MTNEENGFFLAYIDDSLSKAAHVLTSTRPSEEVARGGLSAVWSKLSASPRVLRNLAALRISQNRLLHRASKRLWEEA